MKTKDRDKESYFAIVDSFLNKAELNQNELKILSSELKRFLSIKFDRGEYIHPMITKFCTDWYREFYRLIDFKDPYKNLKDMSNQEAKKILQNIKINSFSEALKLSVKGNQLDYGAVLVLNPDLDKMKEEFNDFSDIQFFIDDSKELHEAINRARSILFLPDNAGEIIFDIPLLQHLNTVLPREKIYIAGKESPMLNDVTFQELKDLGMEKYGTLISTGSNCFGLHEEDVPLDFKRTLKDADLIIAKGQAYLEFFTEYNFKNVFNITRVKYPVINEVLGTLQPHQNVIISSKRYANSGEPYKYGTLHPKIIEKAQLRSLAEKLRAEGKKIVTINGSYDVLHYGHIRTLQEAKKQGNVLMVGLNSDSSIKKYKSPWRPINSQEHRAEFMVALDCVDYVFVFDETVPMPFLEEIKPDIHCNGVEYGEDCIEAPTVKKYGGKIYLTGRHFSTTKMIEKIVEAHQKERELNKKDKIVSKDTILTALKEQKGILFSKPAIVHRSTYSGRNIIAKNSKFEPGYVDDRNYVPVEWWIMSMTQAKNEILKDGEGITEIKIGSSVISLKEVSSLAEKELFGNYKNSWPLTKILDIGGEKVKPSFSEEKEVPPIPAHVHSGLVKGGKIEGPGKLEAYFFPPVDIPPYNQNFGTVKTRLGLKPEITKEEIKEALKKFGEDDYIYDLCKVYEIKPYDGWTIPAGIVHAPGPWITFEIQLPQDDFNLLGWQLGQRTNDPDKKNELQLRGLQDEHQLVEQAINWKISTHPNFKDNHYRPSRLLEQGTWGRRMQIFFDQFYGEAIEIEPGKTFTRNPDERPFAGIVWSGEGKINDNELNVLKEESKEFLVAPNSEVEIINTGKHRLLIYTVFPIKKHQYQLSSK